MYFSNNSGALSKRVSTDVYGEPRYSTPIIVGCAVVHLNGTIKKSPVRADSSASRANADEVIEAAKILFPPLTDIALGDRFIIATIDLRVISVEPRYSTSRGLDHIQCGFEAWPI
jgi:hypothetical protein